MRHLVALPFVGMGILHFLVPKQFEAIMPPYLPAHRRLVYASGAAEIVGGASLLSDRTRAFGGWWLIATLLAVFPANVHMALHPEEYRQVPGGKWSLYARLPFQLLFIAAVRRAAHAR
jgi:uncharacterized membrane protein